MCVLPLVLTLTCCQTHNKAVAWVLNQLFVFPCLRKFPDSWRKFPSWRGFLHREIRQMPEQEEGQTTQSYTWTLMVRVHTETERIYCPAKESTPDILPSLSLSPCSQTSVSPVLSSSSVVIPCTSSDVVLILYWSNSGHWHSRKPFTLLSRKCFAGSASWIGSTHQVSTRKTKKGTFLLI